MSLGLKKRSEGKFYFELNDSNRQHAKIKGVCVCVCVCVCVYTHHIFFTYSPLDEWTRRLFLYLGYCT